MSMSEVIGLARHAIRAWLLGAAVIAPLFGVVCGLVAYPISKRYQERKKAKAEAAKVVGAG
jgi:hypothetical protein